MAVRKKKTKTKARTKKAKTNVSRKQPKEKLIGRVAHYFDKIGVAAITVSDSLKKGDAIRIEGGSISFSQKIASMEIDHKKVAKASKGDDLGIKVKKKVREGYRVYRIQT